MLTRFRITTEARALTNYIVYAETEEEAGSLFYTQRPDPIDPPNLEEEEIFQIVTIPTPGLENL